MRAHNVLLLAVTAALLSSSCGESPAAPATTAWESVAQTSSDASTIVERVSYRSSGLRIVGQVCRPAHGRPSPVLVWNHGGFEGLQGEWNGGLCVDLARLGFAVVESAYRGEDGSDGQIEICLGEADDVIRMLEIAVRQPWADPARVAMMGGSHGGCITLQAIARGARVHAAVNIFGATDFAALHSFWRAQRDAGAFVTVYQDLLTRIERATGGTPSQASAAYAARSPVRIAAAIAARGIPLLTVHGTSDLLVPVEQGCALAAAIGTTEGLHVASPPATVSTSAPAGCVSRPTAWRAGPLPQSWPAERYVAVFTGAGHEMSSPAGSAMATVALTFIATKLGLR